MSNPQSPYSQHHFGESPDWPAPEPRGNSGCVIVVLIFGGGLLALCLCAGLSAYFVARSRTSELLPRETLAEKMTASTAAYGADDVGTDPETLRQITRLMNAVERASRQEDEEAFLALIDFDRMTDYVLQSEAGRSVNFVERVMLPSQIRDGTYNEAQFERIIIRHVDEEERGAIVYVHGIDQSGSNMEYRYWVFREEDQWKIADWERLDLGLRHSDEWALYSKYAIDPRLEAYFDCLREIAEVNTLTANENPNEPQQTFRRAEARSVPPEFLDVQMVSIAYAWQRAGHYDDALRCLDRVGNPDATPGAWYCRANCRAGLEDYEGALEAAHRYEAALGITPDVCGYKAGWLESLDRKPEALAEWRRALRADPENYSALGSFVRLLPDDAKEEVTEYLQKAPDPIAVAESLITYIRYDSAALEAVERFVAQEAPDSALNYYLRGLACNVREEYEAAAQAFRRAAELASESDDKEYYESEYLTAMNDCNQIVAGYEAAFDRQAAFNYLLGEEREEYMELATDEREAILAKHAAYAPDDPWVDYYRGNRLLADRDYEGAAKAFSAAVGKATDEDANKQTLRQAQVSAMAKAGHAAEALTAGNSSPESFQAILQACREAQRWDDLDRLADAYRTQHPDDPLNDYCRALMLLRDEKWNEAETQLKAISQATDGMQYSVDADLRAIRARPERWQAAYNEAEDQREAFQQMVATLYEHGWHADVAALIERHHAKFPEDIEPAYWDARNSQLLRTESQFVDRWFPLRHELLKAEQIWLTRYAVRLLWKTLWQLGRHDDAGKVAHELEARKNRFQSEWVAFLAYTQNTSQCLEAARAAMRQGESQSLYNDQDVGAILRSADYKALHDEFPLPLSVDSHGLLVTLLLRESPANPQQFLVQAFSESDAAASVVAVPEQQGDNRSFVVDHNGLRLRITLGTRPLQVGNSYPPLPWPSVVSEVVQQHQGWLEIRELMTTDRVTSEVSLAPLGAALSRLADANCLALYLFDENALIPWTDSTPTALATNERLSDWKQLGVHANLYLDDTPADPRPARDFRRELKSQLDALVDGKPRGEFQILVELSDHSVNEALWLDVEKFDSKADQFVGSLLTDSRIQPGLQQGSRHSVSRYQVRAARIKDDRGEFNLAIENEH